MAKNKYINIEETDIYDFNNKKKSVMFYINYMLNRTQSMFKYNNLPDTIPQRMLEMYLQTKGHCIIAEVDSKIYAFTGGLGGEPDVYFQPTLYTVANPALNLSKTFKIDDDCVLIRNDSMMMSLMPLFKKYATQLIENDISMRIVDINSRMPNLISASDDRTKASAEKYIADVENGKLGIIAESALLDGLKTQPYTNTGASKLTDLIEYHQYLKAGWYNDIGLNANYNMKRESLNSNESQLNDDMLLPLIDNMMAERRQAVDKINEKFNLNIKVDYSSAWEDNMIELDNAQETQKGDDVVENN